MATRERAAGGARTGVIETKPRDLFQIFVADVVAGGDTDTKNVGGVLPVGVIVKVTRLGGSDAGTGDGKASTIALQMGGASAWTTVWGFSVASNTVDLPLSTTVTGDGTSRLRLVRVNASADAKVITGWVEAHRVK